MFAIAVAGAGFVTAEGVLVHTWDRFPLGTALGRNDIDDDGPGDGAVAPFGMTLRVPPSSTVVVDPVRVSCDHDAQMSVRLPDGDGDMAITMSTHPPRKRESQQNWTRSTERFCVRLATTGWGFL